MEKGTIRWVNGATGVLSANGTMIEFKIGGCRHVMRGDAVSFGGVRANRKPKVNDEVYFERKNRQQPRFATKWGFADN